MDNQSLQIIGKALGHKSTQATQIYARLTADPVRAAMEHAQANMLAAAGLESPSDNVLVLPSRRQTPTAESQQS